MARKRVQQKSVWRKSGGGGLLQDRPRRHDNAVDRADNEPVRERLHFLPRTNAPTIAPGYLRCGEKWFLPLTRLSRQRSHSSRNTVFPEPVPRDYPSRVQRRDSRNRADHPAGGSLLFVAQRDPRYEDVSTSREDIACALGCAADAVSDAPIAVVSTGVPWLIVELTTLQAVQTLTPDYKRIARLSTDAEAVGITVFTRKTSHPDRDAHLRSFAPGAGIYEDPVCGSCHGALAAYLSRHCSQISGALERRTSATSGTGGRNRTAGIFRGDRAQTERRNAVPGRWRGRRDAERHDALVARPCGHHTRSRKRETGAYEPKLTYVNRNQIEPGWRA